jgi:hypothetical protein
MNNKIRDYLLVSANEAMKDYPQYEGFYDNYRLAITKKEVRFKSCTIPTGTVLLAELRLSFSGIEVTLHNPENHHDCSTKEVESIGWI